MPAGMHFCSGDELFLSHNCLSAQAKDVLIEMA